MDVLRQIEAAYPGAIAAIQQLISQQVAASTPPLPSSGWGTKREVAALLAQHGHQFKPETIRTSKERWGWVEGVHWRSSTRETLYNLDLIAHWAKVRHRLDAESQHQAYWRSKVKKPRK